MRRSDRRIEMVLATVAVALSIPGAAFATDPPSTTPTTPAIPPLLVTNLGQPGKLSSVPQPAITPATSGTCTAPRDPGEANGAPSACPAGTWPDQATAGWSVGGTLDAIPGDTLQLAFAQPATQVAVTETQAFPIGIRTPPCPPVPAGGTPIACLNGDQPLLSDGAALAVTAGADASTWLVQIPAGYGSEYAVTATTTTGAANFAFAVNPSLRYDDEIGKCRAYYAVGGQSQLCQSQIVSAGVPPGTPGGASSPADVDTTKPGLGAPTVGFARAPTLRGRTLSVIVTPSETGPLRVTVRQGGHLIFAKTVAKAKTASVNARRTITLPRALAAGMAKHPARRYTVGVTLATGTQTAVANATVRWHR